MKHITFKAVASNCPMPKTLIRAVVKQLHYDVNDRECVEVCRDIVNFGMANGFGGFIYAKDINTFYRKHRVSLINFLMTQTCGALPTELVSSLVKGVSYEEVESVLHGETDDLDDWKVWGVYEAITWYIAYHVAVYILSTADKLNFTKE